MEETTRTLIPIVTASEMGTDQQLLMSLMPLASILNMWISRWKACHSSVSLVVIVYVSIFIYVRLGIEWVRLFEIAILNRVELIEDLNMDGKPIVHEVLWRNDEKHFEQRVNQEPEIM